jgi:ABC-type transport system involved in cytochrome bd biosynthesis fused ATPase/permease subunit
LTSESRQTLSAVTQFIHRLTGSGLNVLFNIAVISILIDRRFALAYAISSVCSAILYKFMLRQQTELATHAQTTRVDLTRTLLSVWDNVVLGNRYNLRLWKKTADQDFDQASASAIRLSDFNQVMSVSIALVTLLPSVAVVILSALAHQTDRVALAALVVTLPRLFMILNYTYEVLVLGSEWNEHKAKISGVVAALKPGRQDLLSRIQWSKIRLERDGQSIIPKDWAHVIAFLSEKGRVTIRGENGAGKSSLLVSLKDHAGEDGFYLPAHHGLSFVSTARAQASTGQTLRMNLTEIATSVEANLILLDEWSANLDAESQKTLSRLVDQVASKKCVVEVIHSS